MAINFPSTAGQATDGSYTYNVAGIIYAWNGSSWEAAGAGASATDRTLFSVSTNPAGTASLSYDNNTGVFAYTPPDLTPLLSQEADTLQTVLSRGNSTGANDIEVPDNQSIKLGASFDLQIFHNTTSGSNIRENGFGPLNIWGTDINILDSTGTQTKATFSTNGSCTLSWSGTTKFETTTNGATITGALTAGGLTYPTSNGTIGQALISDGAGNVGWGDVATIGLQSRQTAQVTQSIANGASVDVSISTAKGFALYSIETSHAAWVTLYTSTAARTADASRSETTDPTPGSGVLAEVITTGSATQSITPASICFNSSGIATTYAKIVNKSGSTANISVTLTYLQLEA
jgi:hypothetical protein|tara:strand:+ start:413 stop:1453 length:1041 start_codon:yes stop_codon:yes gene_type:complete